MMNIGNIELGAGPVVVGTLCNPSAELTADELRVDIIEIRADAPGLGTPAGIRSAVAAFRKRTGKPLLLTVRSKDEGGMSDLTTDARREIYSALLPLSSAVDVELSSPELLAFLRKECDGLGVPLIVSYHNFTATPASEELDRILSDSLAAGADITKIAVTPANEQDVALMLAFASKHRDNNVVALSMGATGAVSRIAAPLFGSLLTYAHLDKQTAPGQFHARDLIDILRQFYPGYDTRMRVNS